jgi:catechol 2,3-dioxygenase-like lactoylglutathione lyase family enzyme
MALHRTILFVSDLPRMASFYNETLGCQPVAHTRTDTWAEFDGGAFALHAIPRELRCDLKAPATPRESSPVKLSFGVDDVATELARLEALGVPMLPRSWGTRDCVDPEGNVFSLCAAR